MSDRIEQLTTGPGPQHIDGPDRVATGDYPTDHRHRLGATVRPTDRIDGQVKVLVSQPSDAWRLGRRARGKQPCVGDEIVLVDRRLDRNQIVQLIASANFPSLPLTDVV